MSIELQAIIFAAISTLVYSVILCAIVWWISRCASKQAASPVEEGMSKESNAFRAESESRRREVLRLRDQGLTFTAIANDVGLTAGWVRQIVANRGKEKTKPRATPRTRAWTDCFSARAKHCLMAAGYESLKEVSESSDSDLLRQPNMGRKTLIEIRDVLSELGYDGPERK